jgi:hypothetical protein
MDALNEVVDEIEAEQERGIIPAFKVFRSILNQPNLVSLNSANATNLSQSGYGYSKFQVTLPRPIFDAQSIQLLNANIPQATQNVPDTACVFWYYRLSQYSGFVPNTNNLYFQRLLPSYYKPENIANSSNYGFNRTFVSYSDIATQLVLAGSNDLAYTNWALSLSYGYTLVPQFLPKFLPGDMSITYNSNVNRFQATGTNAFTPFATAAWASSNTYASNAVVYQVVYPNAGIYPQSNTYQSLVAANSNNSPSTSPTYWKQIYTDIVQPWNSNVPYNTGALAVLSGTIYQAAYQNHNIQPPTFPSLWASSNSYTVNDIVVDGGGVPYTAILPSSNIALSNTAYWLPTTWSASNTYPKGFIAYYTPTLQYYYATGASSNSAPSVLASWANIGPNIWTTYNSPTNYNYLVAGYSDPNVAINQASGVQQWNPYALFESNALVQYNGINYQALNQNKGYVPFNPNPYIGPIPQWSATKNYASGVVVAGLYDPSSTYISLVPSVGQVPSLFSTIWGIQQWSVTSSTPPITTLTPFSAKYDMTEKFSLAGNNFFLEPFPADIPSQPYVEKPSRLLNSILGFSWNGAFSPLFLASLSFNTVYVIGSTAVDIFNRLRPIPRYIKGDPLPVSVSLGASSTTSQTFTADGYANLNYTSVISLYTTIAAASTLDTQRNTNLLGTIQMNCANLGITYAEPTITNEIQVNGTQIDTISISMFDEFGDPYFIGNNAATTLNLRITYKDRLNIK